MLSHGLTTGGLFLGIGVLYERRHTRRLAEYGGIWTQMPVFAGLFLIIVMGSAGLPGLSGFVGEFLSLFGTFNARADAIPASSGRATCRRRTCSARSPRPASSSARSTCST